MVERFNNGNLSDNQVKSLLHGDCNSDALSEGFGQRREVRQEVLTGEDNDKRRRYWHGLLLDFPTIPSAGRQGCRMPHLALPITVEGSKMLINVHFKRIKGELSSY